MNFNVKKWYLGIVLVCGLFMTLVKPPMEVQDAAIHFISMNVFAQGEWNEGDVSPATYTLARKYPVHITASKIQRKVGQNVTWEFMKSAYDLKSRPDDKMVRMKALGAYRLSYIPQTVGIALGKFFSNRPVVWMYFARLLNLLFYVSITYWAILTIPKFKVLFASLALMPGFISNAASIHPDTTLNAISLLFSAFVVRDIFLKQSKNNLWIIIMPLLMYFLKTPYYLISFLPVLYLILNRSKGVKIRCVGALVIVLFASMFIWKGLHQTGIITKTKDSTIVSKASTITSVPTYVQKKRTAKDQVNYLLEHPLHMPKAIVNSWCSPMKYYYINSFFWGGRWMTTPPNRLVITIFFSLLIAIGLGSKSEVQEEELSRFRWLSLVFFIASFGVCILIFIGMYVCESRLNDVGEYMVYGIQGRYFLPFAVFFFLPLVNSFLPKLLDNIRLKLASWQCQLFITTQCVIWFYTVIHIVYYFYFNSYINKTIYDFFKLRVS